MKKFIVVIMILWRMVACTEQPQEVEIPAAQVTIPIERATETAVSATVTTSILASSIAGLPLAQGNYWVYQWESYEVDKTASYVMTTTVDIAMWQDNYFVAHLRDEVKWIEGSPGLIAIPEPASYWYIVDSQYVYR